MRKALLLRTVREGLQVVVAFPALKKLSGSLTTALRGQPNHIIRHPVKADHKPKKIMADCGHPVIAGKTQRELAKKLAICCPVCAFAARFRVEQIEGMEDIDFPFEQEMVGLE